MEDDCIFCKIVKGEIPSHKIWEDEDNIAFLDINPVAKGHTIIIPKSHVRWVWDMADGEYSKLMLATKTVAGFLRKAFDTDCVQESVIGFDVNHAHVHLFPRKKDDGLPIAPTVPLDPRLSEEEMKEISDKIKAVLN